MNQADPINRRLRAFLLLLAVLALLTTLVELWLQSHWKQPVQLVPWIIAGLGLLALLVAWVRPGRASLLSLRVIMLMVALSGLGGIIVHLKENLEFQQEIHPTVGLGDFLLPALQGAAPLLAPGSLTFAALIAIAATYQHPAFSKEK